MDKPGKPYLIFIRLGPKHPEHGNILKTLERISCSVPTQLFLNEGIAFGFRSTLKMGQISVAFGDAKIFLNEDSYVLVELGTEYLVFRADHARAWLNHNLD